MNLAFDQAKSLIERARLRGRPVFVAIDGRSGAGKSTFAVALASEIHAQVIEGDAFFAGGVQLRSDSAEQRSDACIDRPKLRAVLEALRAGRAATYRPFDWEAFDGRLTGDRVVDPADVLIVEGVYSAHPDFLDLLDIKILITAPDNVREQRLLRREGGLGPWERQWHDAEDWYFSHVAAAGHFDLVCSST